MQLRAVGAVFAALILAACASSYPVSHSPARRPPPPLLPAEPRPLQTTERRVPLVALKGWEAEDHAAALAAFRETCGAARDPAMAPVCRSARAIGPLNREQSRRFFEAHFRAEASTDDGVLTAYFAPEYPARHKPDAEFSAPLRAKPADLRPVDAGDGTLAPYPDRAAIEATPPGQALAWLRPEDLFFLQTQGSGVLTFESGKRMKALYAANNGRAFVAVSNLMRDRGLLAGDNTSAEAIRGWLADHRGPDADAIMRLNPRYAFFSLAPDDGRQPVGSANLPLPPGRALAVDPAYHQMGELYWVDAGTPILKGAFPIYRRLALTLDTGGAIKGDVRADLYLGLGAAAGAEAGRVRHTLRMFRLVPKDPAP